MLSLITKPMELAALFKEKVPHARREVTAEDIKDLTACGLIGR